MTFLTTLPEATRSASQNFLHGLPSANRSISKSNKEPANITEQVAVVASLGYVNLTQRFSETVLSSEWAWRDLLQAKQVWTERGISTFYFFEAQLQLLELIYCFRKPGEVLSFLERNKFLVPLLLEARLRIANYFPNTQVFLEIDTDPEEINSQQLVAFIATKFSPDEVHRKLKQFDEEWWLDVLDRAQKKLCINVEFE